MAWDGRGPQVIWEMSVYVNANSEGLRRKRNPASLPRLRGRGRPSGRAERKMNAVSYVKEPSGSRIPARPPHRTQTYSSCRSISLDDKKSIVKRCHAHTA